MPSLQARTSEGGRGVMKKQTILTIVMLTLFATVVSPIDARTRRNNHREQRDKNGGTALGVLAGAGTGGAIAGLAGSAKWVPLGLGVGAIGGYFLVKAIRSNRRGRVSHTKPIETKGRPHIRPSYQKDYESKQIEKEK